MATYYLSSVDGNDADDGSTWALAKATLAGALAVATSGDDVIKVDSAHSESLSADTTYTLTANVRVISVNRAGGDVPLAGAVIGAQATNYAITVSGGYLSYWYGITFANGSNTSSTKTIYLANADGSDATFEACTFTIKGSASSIVYMGFSNSSSNVFCRMLSCTIDFNNAGNKVAFGSGWCVLDQCTLTGTGPTTLFATGGNGTRVVAHACDLSTCTGTLASNAGAAGCNSFLLTNCKLGSGVTMMAATATVLNRGNTSMEAYNCNAGDTHYAMYHGDAFGETTVSVAIYANDGAKYDGTNRCSWKITTTANCSFYWPYKSPWMELYHVGTSAITPALEILRDGSATAYQNDEVWGEFSYQGTSGYPLATIVDDRMTPLGTPADQTTGDLAASGWTGENATAWFGKIAPASAITPAEIGYLRARVCVGEPSITVYVDPTIRGLGITQDKSRVTGSGWMETESSGSGGGGPLIGGRLVQ